MAVSPNFPWNIRVTFDLARRPHLLKEKFHEMLRIAIQSIRYGSEVLQDGGLAS